MTSKQGKVYIMFISMTLYKMLWEIVCLPCLMYDSRILQNMQYISSQDLKPLHSYDFYRIEFDY